MRKTLWHLNFIFLLVFLGSGCASNNYHYREVSYDKRAEKGTILHSLRFSPGIEDKILALDPEHIALGHKSG